MVDNDGDGYRACQDKASDFVCWTEEGPTKIMGVVEDGDPLCAACHEDDVEGLIELRHFFVGVCLKVHCAGETRNVLFTMVSKLKRAVQEVWRCMMVFSLALRVLLGGR